MYSENHIGCQSCVQIPGVISICWYPCLLRLFLDGAVRWDPLAGDHTCLVEFPHTHTRPWFILPPNCIVAPCFWIGCWVWGACTLSLQWRCSSKNIWYQVPWSGLWLLRRCCWGVASLWSSLLWVCRNILVSWLYQPLQWVVCGRGCSFMGDSPPLISNM